MKREPSKKEIALKLDISIEKLNEILLFKEMHNINSLNYPLENENTSLEEIIPNNHDLIEDAFLQKDTEILLTNIINSIELSNEEKRILSLRFGFDNNEVYSREKTGKIVGLNKNKVFRIEKKFIALLNSPNAIDYLTGEKKINIKSIPKMKDYKIKNYRI